MTNAHIVQICRILDAIAGDTTLHDEDRYVERTEALDQLEFPILATLIEPSTIPHADDQRRALTHRAMILHAELSAINTRLFQHLCTTITLPTTTPDQRLQLLRRYISPNSPPFDSGEYDALDVLVNGILQLDQHTEPEEAVGDPEMIRYQPTPARAILELIEQMQIRPTDVFYDLGSGLGHVTILVALLTEASAVGIEIDQGLCDVAQHCIRRLALPTATMVCSDVRAADLSEGTIFYMYTPFTGTILQAVLERLRLIAMQHPIRLCTYGPYLAEVALQPWLTPVSAVGAITVCMSTP